MGVQVRGVDNKTIVVIDDGDVIFQTPRHGQTQMPILGVRGKCTTHLMCCCCSVRLRMSGDGVERMTCDNVQRIGNEIDGPTMVETGLV